MMKSILGAINNMTVPDIDFDGGYMRRNTLNVDAKPNSLIFEPVESDNAILF